MKQTRRKRIMNQTKRKRKGGYKAKRNSSSTKKKTFSSSHPVVKHKHHLYGNIIPRKWSELNQMIRNEEKNE